MTMKHAYSYIRLSTDAQLKGDGERRQLAKSKKYAKEKGYHFVESIPDIGVSAFKGKNTSEGKLGVFLNKLETGEINPHETVFLVESLDRMSRQNVLTAFAELNKFLETGVTVVTMTDRQEYTLETLGSNMGMLYSAIGVMIRANEESEIKSARLKDAWAEKRAKIDRKKMTSIAPAWLRINDTKTEFHLIPERADIVSMIFDMCIDEGMGTYSITRYLNERIDRYPKFTNPRIKNHMKVRGSRTGWNKSYVTKILKNPAVFGLYQPNHMQDGKRVPDGDAIDGYFPEVISKNRFELAQARMHKRITGGRGRKGIHFSNLFTNLAVCKRCGGTMILRDKGKPPKGGKYLRCRYADLKDECDSPAWRYEDFENDFFRHIDEVSFSDVLLTGHEEHRIKKLQGEIDVLTVAYKEQLSTYKRGMKNLPRTLAELKEDFEKELVGIKNTSMTTKTQLNEVKYELAELEARISKKSHKEVIIEIEQLSASLTDEERGHLRRKVHAKIRNVVESIVIDSGPFLIYPWEAEEFLPSRMLRQLMDDEGKSLEEVQSLLDTDYGRRLYNNTQRSFTVLYKSGSVATVQPYSQWKHKTHPKVLGWMLKDDNKKG